MENNKIFKVGVIGSGFIGPVHVEALRRLGGIEVAALADQNGDMARESANRMSIPKYYGDWQEMISDPEIEVIHNCTPTNFHFEINKAALNAGKPIISEKPLGMNSQESFRTSANCIQNGRTKRNMFHLSHVPHCSTDESDGRRWGSRPSVDSLGNIFTRLALGRY